MASSSFHGTVQQHLHKPRKSALYDALKEVGRRTSVATKRLSEQVFLTCDSALTDSEAQKFTECSVLADIDELELKCDDVKAFHSVMPQFLISQNFADIPFKISDARNKTALFNAYLTSSEFVVETVDGKAVFSVAFADADQTSQNVADVQAVGKIKHPAIGIQLYRILQLANKRGGESESFVVRKVNDHMKEPYLKIGVKHSFWRKIAKWLGFVMDSRVFSCRAGDKRVARIRPRVGWNAGNLGYFLRFDEAYKNYTGKTVCLAFVLLMFLKNSPLDFEHLLSAQ